MVDIRKALIRQFDRMWNMLHQSIEKIPDDHWNKGVHEWIYSKFTFHIIETADFYAEDTHKDFVWGKRRGKSKDYLTKKEQLSYLEEIKSKISNLIEGYTIEELNARDDFDWFHSRFEKFLYLLRHNAHHIGELALMLRIWGFERIKWT